MPVFDVKIKTPNGNIVFQKDQFKVPFGWSERAATICASKYAMDNENSAEQIIDRIVNQITQWGYIQLYFSTNGDIENFSSHLKDIFMNQRAALNSPVWFNCGSNSGNNQMSACFVLPIEDNMEAILDHYKKEGMIFKGGSGSGINISKLRAKGEKLSNKGSSSGPLSFMRGWDRSAAGIKSGGKVRRASKLVCMDVDHPDIFEFINCKKQEEDKAKILIENGISSEEAYSTVDFQNTNHSIRVTDEFMHSVLNDEDWNLINRGDKEIAKTIKAKDLLWKAAEIAHNCGDPGIQFHDRMNNDNPVPSVDIIRSTNPCQPGFAKILTQEGIRTFDDIEIGSIIWSGKQWTKITNKVNTGVKTVNEYQTTVGSFIGTENHVVFQNGQRIEVKDADSIDYALGPQSNEYDAINKQDIIDGWVFGDGSAHKASNNLVYLNNGKDDIEVLQEKFSLFLIKDRSAAFHDNAWEVKTTITSEEIPNTYLRKIPERFLKGNQNKICGFLRGLYNANGSICGQRITLKATSFDVIKNVQIMLSSIGIPSYFTTNKEKSNKFKNGEYTCKESYDLNITKGRNLFSKFIGFDHPHKNEKLNNLLMLSSKKNKKSYEIIKINNLGDYPVYDITVEAEEHSYWTDGLLVSNCSEFSAVNNSSCNLCSINLVKYITPSDSDLINFNWYQFELDIKVLITAMDILIDAAEYPTPEIKEMTSRTRPLGLGFANLGALLISYGIPYFSEKAREIASEITRRMTLYAYEQSQILAEKLDSYYYFEENKKRNYDLFDILCSKNNSKNTLVDYYSFKLRNSQLTLLAPSGTISFVMDCETTGIEPLFNRTIYKNLSGGGVLEMNAKCVDEYITKCKNKGIEVNKEVYETANEISWKSHIDMMAACQKHLNGAISKTVNLSNNATVQDVYDAYIYAFKSGLKAVAIYRDGSKGMQPLTTKKDKEIEIQSQIKETSISNNFIVRKKLNETRDSKTHKFNVSGFEGYFTVGLYEDKRIGEIFIHSEKQGSTMQGLLDSFAVAISMSLQYGVPIEKYIEKYKSTNFAPSGFTTNKEIPMTTSIIDYIFKWIELYNNSLDKTNNVIAPKKEETILSFDGPPCANCSHITSKVGACFLCSKCGTSNGCS